MRRLIVLAALAASVTLAPPAADADATTAAGGGFARVEIHDLTDGRELPVYRHGGRLYVAGEPGHEYEIRVHNRSGGRVLAVTSVDGVNVVTGETASPAQRGYVLEPGGRVVIDGWRKSLEQVAAFYFTALPDAYAARTGRPDEVGVIGVALFRERVDRCCELRWRGEHAAADAAAPSSRAQESSQELGTGHGRERDSRARYTSFERESASPAEIITILYDSHRRLAARGVIPPARHAWRHPDPFPGRFVPDPP